MSIRIFKNDKFELKPKQISAIELLINCQMNQKEIAAVVGVTERTLYNWIHHDEEFRRALEWYRREIYKDLAPTAVKTIADIMLNGESEKARLAAAQDILSRAGDDAVTELDLKENELNVNITVV